MVRFSDDLFEAIIFSHLKGNANECNSFCVARHYFFVLRFTLPFILMSQQPTNPSSCKLVIKTLIPALMIEERLISITLTFVLTLRIV